MFFYSCQNLWRFLPKILPYFLVGRRGGLVSRVEWVDSGVEMGASAGQKTPDFTSTGVGYPA